MFGKKKAVERNLNSEQKEAFSRLVKGENLFITGNAGTGKSFLINAFSKWCDDNNRVLIKTAPTGAAANLIDGATLHSQFNLKFGLDLTKPNKYPQWLDDVDSLLIDEVPMVRIDIFDKIMWYITLANNARKKDPIQVILCGDFFQLPPVVTSDVKSLMDEHYGRDIGKGYCFHSHYWNEMSIKTITLKTVMRQNDVEFCNALDRCKIGDASCIEYFINNCADKEIKNAIWICGKNATVNQKNSEALNQLKGKLYSCSAEYKREACDSDKLCEPVFEFKIGARVVSLINNPFEGYINGSLGTIISVNNNNTIRIKFDDIAHEVNVEKHVFKKYRYEYEETIEKGKRHKILKQVTVGEALQYPLRLGYAVTVHKSQGQTYSKMNFNPEIFSEGQLYVALSRCTKAENIFYYSPLKSSMVRTSKEVLNFFDIAEEKNNHLHEEGFKDKEQNAIDTQNQSNEENVTISVPKKYESLVLEYINSLQNNEQNKLYSNKTDYKQNVIKEILNRIK